MLDTELLPMSFGKLTLAIVSALSFAAAASRGLILEMSVRVLVKNPLIMLGKFYMGQELFLLCVVAPRDGSSAEQYCAGEVWV